jgi:hypothetical protein
MVSVADRDLELLREEIRAHREESRAEIRAMREESREFIRWMVMSFERQTAVLRELQQDAQAQREGFLSLIDELRRHGLGGAQA